MFQHTAARRRLLSSSVISIHPPNVSTHSRPKAAACFPICHANANVFQHTAARRRLHELLLNLELIQLFQHTAARRRLPGNASTRTGIFQFQHTAARRRLPFLRRIVQVALSVSTHSRPKAAAYYLLQRIFYYLVSTHSRPKAAAKSFERYIETDSVSTHSRPKAAATIWRA